MTQMAVIKKINKRKRKKVQGAKCVCMTGVSCDVIGNVLNVKLSVAYRPVCMQLKLTDVYLSIIIIY